MGVLDFLVLGVGFDGFLVDFGGCFFCVWFFCDCWFGGCCCY